MHPSPSPAIEQRVRSHLCETDSYAFFNLLTGPGLFDRVESLLPEHRERLFPPTETLSMFLAQVLSADGSCQAVVDAAAVKRLLGGLAPCHTNTGGYCKARGRLPQSMIETLARDTGGLITEGACDLWHWKGRRVRLVDGTTLTLPDT